MSPRIITAAEAAALLNAREAKGAWRAGTVEGEGKVWAHDPTALGGPSVGEVCIFNANTYRPHNGNRALAAAAPDLAHTVVAQAAEIERLRASLDRAHYALREWGPGCEHPGCNNLAPLRCEDCGARFCDDHDGGSAGHDSGVATPMPHAVGPDDLMAGVAMREAQVAR